MLGAFTIAVSYRRTPKIMRSNIWINANLLNRIILFMSFTAFLGILIKLSGFLKVFGSIHQAYENIAIARALLTEEEIIYASPLVGYLSSIGFAAAPFAGLYLAFSPKRSIVPYLPLLVFALNDLIYFGRTWTMLGLILYGYAFILARICILKRTIRLKEWFILCGVLFLGLGISSYALLFRVKGQPWIYQEYMQYAPAFLREVPQVFGLGIIFHYVYFTASIPAFSYWLENFDGKLTFGATTFAPIFRFVKHLGVNANSPALTWPVIFVPVPTNSYTILGAIYQDFGEIGIIMVPYVLALIMGYLYVRIIHRPNLTSFVLLVNLYCAITTSTYFNAFGIGYFDIGFASSLLFAVILGNYLLQGRAQSASL